MHPSDVKKLTSERISTILIQQMHTLVQATRLAKGSSNTECKVQTMFSCHSQAEGSQRCHISLIKSEGECNLSEKVNKPALLDLWIHLL